MNENDRNNKRAMKGSDEQKDGPLPPRRKVHPSNKLQTIRWYYNFLIVSFLLLTAGLMFWGIQFLE
jgi:hypothetical protein